MWSLLAYAVPFINKNTEFFAWHPTSCPSLKRLQLEMLRKKDYVEVLSLLLGSYTKLQALRISFKTYYQSTDNICINVKQRTQELATGDLLKLLTEVEIDDFGGDENELHIVRYLLKNANLMEKLKIRYMCCAWEKVELQTWIKKVSPNAKSHLL
ncbi:hypothetical protein IFM89_026444 [Coptis chinensis]|uniref:FBD domain-containing protein n=1 Tax=Coptis chinensis TaxID=261450 RepID=A0A835H2Q0_9MAGN|nr:hypothetical protein IFM89_026444 [Coptis chinensis]